MGTRGYPSLVAILLTDAVGSTAVRSRLGEEVADDLRRTHDDLLGAAIAEHGGWVVKGSGDGLLAAFASAADALSAAVAGQQAIARHNDDSSAAAPLSVRMGLSVGDVAWEDDDCFGTPVIEAARLEAEAEPDQILCTEFVKLMARGRGGHRFVDVGLRELKGLPEPIGVTEVAWDAPDLSGADPPLVLPSAVAAAATSPIVGRADELDASLAHLGGDGLRLLLLVGEAGIGKTRLAADIAARCHDLGSTVLFGRCDEDIAVPFQPVIEALDHVVSHVSSDRLAELVGAGATELGRLRPDLMRLIPGVEPPTAVREGHDIYRLFEAVRTWLVNQAVGGLVLVIDDLQWGSPPTLQLVRHLLRHPEPPQMSIVATVRDSSDTVPAVQRLLDDVASSPASTTIQLGGLGTDAIAELTGDELGAARIGTETGGNALFIMSIVDDGGRGPSPDLRSAVRRRLGEVTPDERDLLTLSAVAGQDFDLRALAAGLGRTLVDLAPVLEHLRRRALLEQVSADRGRFSHGLVRTVMLDEIGATPRAVLHERYARALEATPQPDLLVLAHHWRAALPVLVDADADHVCDILARAGRVARDASSLDQATVLLGEAAELASTDGRRARLLFEAGDTARIAARFGEARDVLDEAYEAALGASAHDTAKRAAISHSYASFYPGRSVARSRQMTTELLGHPASSDELQAELLMVHGAVLGHSGHRVEARRAIERGLDLADGTSDPWVLVVMLSALQQVLRAPGEVREALAFYRRSEDALSAADGVPLASYWLLRSAAELETNNVPSVEEWLRIERDMRRSGIDHYLTYDLLNNASRTALLAGRLDEAEELAERSLTIGSAMEGLDATGVHGVQMFSIRREQGRLAETGAVLELLAKQQATVWQPGLAALYAELARREQCRQILDERVLGDEVDLPDDDRRGVSLGYLAEAATVSGHPSATAIRAALEPYAGLNLVMHSTCCSGPAERYLGMLSRSIGELDRSVDELERAVRMAVDGPTPTYEARSRLDAAVSRIERDGAGDREVALAHLERAAELAERFGMAGVRQDVAAQLERVRG